MKLGICTRYSRHEATFAAIRIANWVESAGHAVSVFTMTGNPATVDTHWDKTLWRANTCAFTDWFHLENVDAVLCTHVPPLPMLNWLRTNECPLHVLAIWHEWCPHDRDVLSGCTTVLFPHMAGYTWGRQWGLRNVVPLLWDTGEPFFTKPREYTIDCPKIYLPLYDGNCRRMQMTTLEIAHRALLRCPEARFTIAYSSSTIASCGHKKIRELDKKFAQLTVLKAVPVSLRPLLFQQHDLTLWPTEYESTCMLGLSSATMGTPVLTFCAPPVNECFNDRNAICVESQLTSDNLLGLPRAVPDYEMMDELLYQALRDVDFLRSLQQQAMCGLVERRKEFNQVMQHLIV